jgi:hypothetical protein
LQPLARRFLARSHGHIDLLVGQLPALGPHIAQPRRQGQAVDMFKFLGCLDRTAGLPLSQPNPAIQPYTADQDVNVILVRVLVAYGHPGRTTLIKSHAL